MSEFSWITTKILIYLQTVSMSVSVLTLTAIAYNRYQGKYVDNVEVDVNLGILETCPQLSTTA